MRPATRHKRPSNLPESTGGGGNNPQFRPVDVTDEFLDSVDELTGGGIDISDFQAPRRRRQSED